MNKIINYFFKEDEQEIIDSYKRLMVLALISLLVIILAGQNGSI